MPAPRPDNVEKIYYSASEVCHALSINLSKLHYYEKAFNLHFHRSGRHRNRALTVSQLGGLALIVRLTEHLTIASAQSVFQRGIAQDVLDLLEPGAQECVGGVPMRIVV